MICFDLMRQMGIPTPLRSYTAVYLNGEYLGLYMAMEGVDTSFAVRNFGYDYGQLYKPEEFDLAAILTGKWRTGYLLTSPSSKRRTALWIF